MKVAGQRWRAAAMGALAMLFAACKDGGTEAPRPTAVVAASPTAQTAVSGTAVTQAPAVRVTDQKGQAMAGVAVTFVVTAGGGTLSSAAVTTNAEGVATAGTWTLGPAAGQNTVTATVGNLAPVHFVATALARTPTSITAVSPTTQTAAAGQNVPQAPAVRVNDQTGQPLAGATVTFAITAGGGGALGSTTATTNTSGVATSGFWLLGSNPGQYTVTATVAGLAPVVFTATATGAADPCQVATLYTPLTTVSGALTASDCRLGQGYYVDFYETTLPSAQAITFRMNSAEVDAWVELYSGDGDILAFSDDVSDTNTNAALNVFAPSGDYFVAATTFDPGELGSYTLSSAAFSGNNNCGEYWVVPGIIVNGTVATTDCAASGYYSDLYFLVLQPGQQLTVRMESTAFDAVLELYDAITGQVVAEDDDGGGGSNAQIVYTATELNVFAINATTFNAGSTGSYALTITSTGAERTAVLRPGQLPSGLLDAARASAGGRADERKAAASVRGSASRTQRFAPTPRVKRAGTR
ncbi:MAG TPA: hypothetical protein VHG08_29010 [Longimicrobium sp.]|nr:hypothetical protein [Longimicrobium sp.]